MGRREMEVEFMEKKIEMVLLMERLEGDGVWPELTAGQVASLSV